MEPHEQAPQHDGDQHHMPHHQSAHEQLNQQHHFGSVPPAGPTAPVFVPQPAFQPVTPIAQPVQPPTPVVSPASLMPQPVIQVFSPRGVEYVFMTITLFTSALGLGGILLALVNGAFDFEVLAFPTAVLVTAVPVFAWLFLRLKAAELRDPSLRLDASKRRSTQSIQIVSFLISFFTMIGLVGTLFAGLAGQFDGSVFKLVLDVLVVELVSGSILFYYWHDEHRA